MPADGGVERIHGRGAAQFDDGRLDARSQDALARLDLPAHSRVGTPFGFVSAGAQMNGGASRKPAHQRVERILDYLATGKSATGVGGGAGVFHPIGKGVGGLAVNDESSVVKGSVCPSGSGDFHLITI